jgi:hypothetical protein
MIVSGDQRALLTPPVEWVTTLRAASLDTQALKAGKKVLENL